jgi:hypothetical protein
MMCSVRIPAVAIFSAPVQTGSAMGLTQPLVLEGPGHFPGGKVAEEFVDHPLPSSAEMKETVELYYFLFWAFMACFRVNFTFA